MTPHGAAGPGPGFWEAAEGSVDCTVPTSEFPGLSLKGVPQGASCWPLHTVHRTFLPLGQQFHPHQLTQVGLRTGSSRTCAGKVGGSGSGMPDLSMSSSAWSSRTFFFFRRIQ